MTKEVVIRQPTEEDARYINSKLRVADINEIHAFGINDTLKAVMYSFHMSPLQWVTTVDDEPITLFGVSTQSAVLGHGCPWLLGTDKILDNQTLFLRNSVPYMDVMQSRYAFLSNYVHEDNHASKRWLQWMGFQVQAAVPLGIRGAKFHYFTRSKH